MPRLRLLPILALLLVPTLAAAQAPDPGFNPSKIIEDSRFVDLNTFSGPEGIQKFLQAKGSPLANLDPAFLAKLKEPADAGFKQKLDDPGASHVGLRTAAELIWDAARQSGLNPQVILVTLNKEQGLITGRRDAAEAELQKALDRAMGFACPDGTGCGNLFPGFYFQLFGNLDGDGNRYIGAAKSLMKSYTTSGGRGPAGSKVGDTIEIGNTLGAYDVPAQQNVTLMNLATAALYRYTPHVFNGNYNFWKYFRDWFSYRSGTIVQIVGGTGYSILQDGGRLSIPQFVINARGISVASAISVPDSELADFPPTGTYGPSDNTVVQVPGSPQKYVFVQNVKRPASALVLKQRGLDDDAVLPISTTEDQLFAAGPALAPKDGTIVRAETSKQLYLVSDGKVMAYTPLTLKQFKPEAQKGIELVPDAEVASYAQGGAVVPKEGTYVRDPGTKAVYVVGQQVLHPLTAELFKNRRVPTSKIETVATADVAAMPKGPFATPADRTFFSVGSKTGALYIFKEGAKHPISPFVAKQRGITPDFVFGAGESSGWSDGIAIAPRDGTYIKGSGDGTIFLVQKGQLKPLSAKAFARLKVKPSKINVLPQDEVDAYAKGDAILK